MQVVGVTAGGTRAKPGMAAAKPGMAASRSFSGARLWLRGALLASAALLAAPAGCGGEVIGPDDLSDEPPASSTSPTSPPSTGGCARCDTSVECGHCYIQGNDVTYRCPPGLPAPESGCMSLNEVHRDQSGELFTCYYCG